jgi:hypothetical protein
LPNFATLALTVADGGRTYITGTWKPGAQLGPGTPWDATSTVAILGLTSGSYRLVELTTGRELARFEDQDLTNGQAAFSPDGAKLVIEANNGLRVWDLRRIRESLAVLGLDWDAPPFPPTRDHETSGPLAVTIDRGNIDAALEAEH